MRMAPVPACFRALVAAVLVGAGCADGDAGAGGSDAGFRGFMVLRPEAVNFGLTPGDTLVEVPAARAPAAVREDVEREARRIDYPVGCTRYFVSGPAVVVFAAKDCYGDSLDVLDHIIRLVERPGTHDWGVVLFRQEGGRFVRDPRPFNAWVSWCPSNRDKRGRPSGPC